MRRRLIRVAAALVAAALASSAARAEAPTVVGLIKAGDYGAARALAKKRLKGAPGAAAGELFVEGLILVAQHHDKAAIKVFEAILKAQPQNEPARAELAKALYRTGRFAQARLRFNELVENSRNPAERSTFSRYAELAAQAKSAKSGLTYKFYIALAPSTNLNKGSGHNTYTVGDTVFVIDDKGRAQAGLGLSFGGSATYLQPVRGGAVEYNAGFDGLKYVHSEYDDDTVSFSARYIRNWRSTRLAIGPYVDNRWIGYSEYSTRFGMSGGLLSRLGAKLDVFASGFLLKQNYPDYDYEDGWLAIGSVMLRRQFGADAYLAFGLGSTYEKTRADYLTHTDLRGFAEYGRHFSGGVFVAFSPSYEHHWYAGDFPGLGEPRDDDEASVALTASYDGFAFHGFVPQLTYRYTRQFSNVSFYDYASNDLSLGFRRTF